MSLKRVEVQHSFKGVTKPHSQTLSTTTKMLNFIGSLASLSNLLFKGFLAPDREEEQQRFISDMSASLYLCRSDVQQAHKYLKEVRQRNLERELIMHLAQFSISLEYFSLINAIMKFEPEYFSTFLKALLTDFIEDALKKKSFELDFGNTLLDILDFVLTHPSIKVTFLEVCDLVSWLKEEFRLTADHVIVLQRVSYGRIRPNSLLALPQNIILLTPANHILELNERDIRLDEYELIDETALMITESSEVDRMILEEKEFKSRTSPQEKSPAPKKKAMKVFRLYLTPKERLALSHERVASILDSTSESLPKDLAMIVCEYAI